MGFMDSYKRLDNICKDMNGIGITGYIDDMEENSYASLYVNDWELNYNKLKHYRHIRNKIAHENNINEENTCKDEDAEWLDNFCEKILKQKDPLYLATKNPDTLPVYQQRSEPLNNESKQQSEASFFERFKQMFHQIFRM